MWIGITKPRINIAKCNVLNVVGSRLAVRIVNNDVFIVSGKEYSGPLFEQNNATNNNKFKYQTKTKYVTIPRIK